MNETTRFVYESAIGKITFAFESDFWVTEIDGASSVDIDVFESRSAKQIGASITGESIQPRTIPLDGCIYEPLSANRARLINVVAPGMPATLTVVQGGKEWFLDVVPKRTPNISPGNGVQHFQMELYAAYPYWRTTVHHSAQVAGLTPLFKFPFFTGGTWYLSKYSENYFATIQNKGNVPISFKLMFSAKSVVVNPEIYHMTTKQRIRINKTLVAGEKIAVSTIFGGRGVVMISPDGVQSNGFRYLSIDSDLAMALLPGDNLIRGDAEQNREGLGVRIESPEGVRSGV